MLKGRKKIWLAVIFLCMFPILSECGEGEDRRSGDICVPDNMDVVKEADVNVLVPRGGQINKQSSFLVAETPDEYSSRKFVEMEYYLNNIRKEIEVMRRELMELRAIVGKVALEKDK